MKYTSTRGFKQELSSAQAIIKGIADDGGLYIPVVFPMVDGDFINELIPLDYQKRAVKVLAKFLEDYTEAELIQCINRAYSNEKFDAAAVAPLTYIEDKTAVLELWHGPTSAFKDMALQLLPQLMSKALKKTGNEEEIVILVATSGDTGKAALEGFKDVEKIRIVVFYPQTGVSRIQRLQMVTQEGGNVSVVAVDGNFDDAQTGVKNIFNDEAFNVMIAKNGYRLSSANSINWGRLVPQIVYYFSAYADLVRDKKIAAGDQVNFVVPTGNFGNILAGYYAKLMGLPVNRLICASNANNVLTDFLLSGTYDRKRAFHKTNTPSMDILISSNLERLLYHITKGDSSQVNDWMDALNDAGEYTVEEKHLKEIHKIFWADWADDAKTNEQIKAVFDRYHYVMDTHTAVAWQVAESYKKATGDDTLNVIISTASPYKFNESVLDALQVAGIEQADEFALLDELAKINDVKAPVGLSGLRGAPVLHKKQCGKREMMNMIKSIMK